MEASLPADIAAQLQDLLRVCSGLKGPVDWLYLTMPMDEDYHLKAFPYTRVIAGGGFGNDWIMALEDKTRMWGPVLFICHDPPAVVYQAHNILDIIRDILTIGSGGGENPASEPCGAAMEIYSNSPGELTCEQLSGSADKELAAFAKALDESYYFMDLRNPKPRCGFSLYWLFNGGDLRRDGGRWLFAYTKPLGFWGRMGKALRRLSGR